MSDTIKETSGADPTSSAAPCRATDSGGRRPRRVSRAPARGGLCAGGRRCERGHRRRVPGRGVRRGRAAGPRLTPQHEDHHPGRSRGGRGPRGTRAMTLPFRTDARSTPPSRSWTGTSRWRTPGLSHRDGLRAGIGAIDSGARGAGAPQGARADKPFLLLISGAAMASSGVW